MSSPARTRPVEDSIPKINNELAIGENLDFQRRWWRFEHWTWILFTLIVVLDLIGVFGRGPVAKATFRTPDGAMNIEYERVERYQTPSLLTIHFTDAAVRDKKIELWVSKNLVKALGNQRIIPQPASSTLFQEGITYTFLANERPDSVTFALEPATLGSQVFTLRLQGVGDEISRKIFVMP
jgi:hypothetical protein